MARSGEIGQGVQSTKVVYEGDGTRTDVVTHRGVVEKGVTFAAQISEDRIDDGNAYVKQYATWDDAVQKVADNDNGNLIKGRVIQISKDVPDIAANGGTWTAARAGARKATVEYFTPGQEIQVYVNGTTPIAISDKLSLDSGSDYKFVKDNTNGRFYALEAATTDGVWISARVIA